MAERFNPLDLQEDPRGPKPTQHTKGSSFKDTVDVHAGGSASSFEKYLAVRARDDNSDHQPFEADVEARPKWYKRIGVKVAVGVFALAATVGGLIALDSGRSATEDDVEACLEKVTGAEYNVEIGIVNGGVISVNGEEATFTPDSNGDYAPIPGSVFEGPAEDCLPE